MKKKIILISLLVLIFIIILFICFKPKYKIINYDGFTIIDLNKVHTKHFLYEDREYIYYIKGDPSKMYYVTGSTDLINKDTINNIKEGLYDAKDSTCQTFNNKANCYYVTNLVKYAYMKLEVPEELKIVKKERKKITVDLSNYAVNNKDGRNLYYKDKNGIKLYLNNMDEYKITIINKEYKFSKLLDKYNVSLDDLYASLRYDYTDTTLYYEDSSINIDCIIYGKNKMKICRYFKDNELYYEISETKRAE